MEPRHRRSQAARAREAQARLAASREVARHAHVAPPRRAMISRHWKGTTKPGLAESYLEHLRAEVFPKLRAIPGFVSAQVLRRDVSQLTEVQVVTPWESLAAIRAFAGEDLETA